MRCAITELPGVAPSFSQPIALRVDELVSGVKERTSEPRADALQRFRTNGAVSSGRSFARTAFGPRNWLPPNGKQMDSWKLRARGGLHVVTLIISFGLLGCENMRNAGPADGLLDFVMRAAGRAQSNVAPIETGTTGGGEVATARAVAEGDRISIRGSVKKRSEAGWVSSAYAHLDIIVFNSRRGVTQSTTATFSPSSIPATMRGTEGRSHYSVIIRRPAPGSTISIRFHNVPRQECRFYQPAPPSVHLPGPPSNKTLAIA